MFTANDRPYNGSTSAIGTLSLPEKIGSDDVHATYTACTFDSPLAGVRSATATGIVLYGTQSSNYILADTTATDDAVIQKATLYVDVISYRMNQTAPNFIKAKILEKASEQNILLPNACVITDSIGDMGVVTNGIYARTGIFHNTLGILWDTMKSQVVVDGVPCIELFLTVTTGQPMIYADNTTKYEEETSVISLTATEDSWQTEGKAQKIATNAPATASLDVYLRKGECLLVDTAIGLYHGRMDVTVTKTNDSSVLATDRIDAFFPVHYDENFYVSKLSDAALCQSLTQRGDYWDGVVPFTAPQDGVYTFTFTVTGDSYLHSVDHHYATDMPARKPVTELHKFTITIP